MSATLDKATSTTLDEMYELVEGMHVPEGYRVEIIEGRIVVSPQRDTHWDVIMWFSHSLLIAFARKVKILSDVRIDFPGVLNGFAPDLAVLRDGWTKVGSKYDYRDVQLVVEVVSYSSRHDDYDVKLKAYARAKVPVYVIADPRTGLVRVHESSDGKKYQDVRAYTFGSEFRIRELDLTIDTAEWSRDN